MKHEQPAKEISLVPLKKALSSVSEIVKETKTKIIRDASIQRFEYTFELSWKILKRYLENHHNVIEPNIKNIFREAGKLGLIDSVEDWFEFLRCRNLTSHTYHEETAEEVYSIVVRFESAVSRLIQRLEKLL